MDARTNSGPAMLPEGHGRRQTRIMDSDSSSESLSLSLPDSSSLGTGSHGERRYRDEEAWIWTEPSAAVPRMGLYGQAAEAFTVTVQVGRPLPVTAAAAGPSWAAGGETAVITVSARFEMTSDYGRAEAARHGRAAAAHWRRIMDSEARIQVPGLIHGPRSPVDLHSSSSWLARSQE